MLLEVIRKQGKGFIEVDLVGHAGDISLTIGNTTISAGSGFALGGSIHGARLNFTPGAMIHAESIKANLDAIKAVRDRFNTQTANACITLYACRAGIDKKLLAEMAKAFQVCARGFTNEIFWCIKPPGRERLTEAEHFTTLPSSNGIPRTARISLL